MAKLIPIEGRGEVSEETIKQALDEKFGKTEPKPEPYQFKAGDVCKNMYGDNRIIIKERGELRAFARNGGYSGSYGQKTFEEYKYRKIGVISDFIK